MCNRKDKDVPNVEKYNFPDFTRDNYRKLLRLAKKKYVFTTFDRCNVDGPFVIWRHDVDFSPHSARRFAIIEAEENVKSTYFLLLHSEFYNLMEKEVTDCIKDIVDLGHTIGLHVDGNYYNLENEVELRSVLKREKRILQDIFRASVDVFSFHITTPFAIRCDKPTYAGMINAHSKYLREKVGYCSDSNGYWRFKRLEDVLSEAAETNLQVLTHPELWQDTVMSPKERVWRCIDGRADKTKEWYSNILKEHGRENIDWHS